MIERELCAVATALHFRDEFVGDFLGGHLDASLVGDGEGDVGRVLGDPVIQFQNHLVQKADLQPVLFTGRFVGRKRIRGRIQKFLELRALGGRFLEGL